MLVGNMETLKTLKTIPLTVEALLDVVNTKGFYLGNCILAELSECNESNCHDCVWSMDDHDEIKAEGVLVPVLDRDKVSDDYTKTLFTLGRTPEGEYLEINHEGDLCGSIYITRPGVRQKPDQSDNQQPNEKIQ
jgi:hypothetical protein